jgi:hypothetical protein
MRGGEVIMAKSRKRAAASTDEQEKFDKDRRHHESWLHDALELSLFDRFQLGKLEKRGMARDRALILHGQRSGAHPDFALLDANQKLILVEIKLGKIASQAKTEAVVKQVLEYARDYAQLVLGELASWYCQHGVDVNTRFGYRGEDYIEPSDDHGFEYGRLNRWSLDNLKRYRDGFKDGQAALKCLRKDYFRHTEASLEHLEASDHLEVGRCIVIAESWPDGFGRKQVDGLVVEPWSYPAPALWTGPGLRRSVDPAT